MSLRVGLDIDGVICDFISGFFARAHELNLGDKLPCCPRHVTNWTITSCSDAFRIIWKSLVEDEAFWLGLNAYPNAHAEVASVAPVVYITSRRIPTWVTEKWLFRVNRFSLADVITVKQPLDKLSVACTYNLDLFIDDHIETVRAMLAAGINALLYEAPYQCGHKCDDLPKISSLLQLADMKIERIRQHATI